MAQHREPRRRQYYTHLPLISPTVWEALGDRAHSCHPPPPQHPAVEHCVPYFLGPLNKFSRLLVPSPPHIILSPPTICGDLTL